MKAKIFKLLQKESRSVDALNKVYFVLVSFEIWEKETSKSYRIIKLLRKQLGR